MPGLSLRWLAGRSLLGRRVLCFALRVRLLFLLGGFLSSRILVVRGAGLTGLELFLLWLAL